MNRQPGVQRDQLPGIAAGDLDQPGVIDMLVSEVSPPETVALL